MARSDDRVEDVDMLGIAGAVETGNDPVAEGGDDTVSRKR